MSFLGQVKEHLFVNEPEYFLYILYFFMHIHIKGNNYVNCKKNYAAYKTFFYTFYFLSCR